MIRYGVTADSVDVIPNARSSSEFDVADEASEQHRHGVRWVCRRRTGRRVRGVDLGGEARRSSLSTRSQRSTTPSCWWSATGPNVQSSRSWPQRGWVIGRSSPDSSRTISDVYAAIDLLLLTSVTEGMPGVIIEAAMSGVPVVAPDVGAVRWLFENGVQGESVSTDAVAQEYSAAIARTAVTPRTGEAVVLQACAWGTVVEQWARILGLVSPLARPEVAA